MNLKLKNKLIFFILFCLKINHLYAQDVYFSQFYSSPIFLNPSLSGTSKNGRLALNYRNQYPALPAAYKTYALSYDQYFPAIYGGLGFQIMQDEQADGQMKQFNAASSYSYHTKMSRFFSVAAGLEAAYRTNEIDFDKMIFPDQVNPLNGIQPITNELGIHSTRRFWDFATGITGFFKNTSFGATYHHMVYYEIGDFGGTQDIYPGKLTLHFGMTIAKKRNGLKKSDMKWVPLLMYQQQNDYRMIYYGMYFLRNPLMLGFWIKQNTKGQIESFISMVGISVRNLKIRYSYDFPVGNLRNGTSGAIELSLLYEFDNRNGRSRKGDVPCPTF